MPRELGIVNDAIRHCVDECCQLVRLLVNYGHVRLFIEPTDSCHKTPTEDDFVSLTNVVADARGR